MTRIRSTSGMRRAAVVAAILVSIAGLASSRSTSPQASAPRASRAIVEARGEFPHTERAHAPLGIAAGEVAPELTSDDARLLFARVEPVIDSSGVEVAASEVLVAPQPGRALDVEAALRRDPRVRAVQRLEHAELLRVRLHHGVAIADAREAMRATEGVADTSPNAIVRGSGREDSRGQARRVMWNAEAMHLPSASVGRRGDGRARVVLALLDSGVAYRAHTHAGRVHRASPGLDGAEIVAPFDAIDHDGFADDENGHGTFLANLAVGAPGLARGAGLMPVRVLDDELVGTEAALIEGLAHARLEGADVVNLSLVFDAEYVPTRLLDAAIAETLASGVVIVAAAGNDGAPQVRYPAAFPGVVAVGASTPSGRGANLERAHYSSYGAALDVLAPGGDLDADANRDGVPDGIVAESFDRTTLAFAPWLYAGTSQAAAHASAAALYVLAAGGDAASMPGQLRETARGSFDVESGGGLLDVADALSHRVRLPQIGVQTVAVLRALDDGGRGVLAPVVVVDGEGEPVRRAEVHARFRGAVEASVSCVTSREGTCTVEAAPLGAGPALVAVEVEAVVLRDGSAVRPATLTSMIELEDALAATDGTGFGSSSTVWTINPAQQTWWRGATTTYFVYGSGASSALAPTVIAFDDAVATSLRQRAGTSGDASVVFVPWRPESFLGGSTSGGGFGSSSLNWAGWSFSWYGWGSMVYSMFGAEAGRVQAR